MAHQRPLAPAPAAAAAATTTASPGSASSSSSLDPHLTAAAGLLASASASSSSSQPTASASRPAAAPTTSKPAKKPRRSKVAEACRFCRRSHMSCDAGRPCSRCVKRDIAHLCRDEPISSLSAPPPHPPSPAPASASASPKPRPPPPAAAQSTDKTPQPNSSVSQSATGALGANLLGLETVNGGAISSRPSLTPSLSATAANLSMAGSLGAGGGGQPTMSFATTQDGAGGYGQQQLPMLSTNFNLAMLDLASGQDGLGAGLGLDMTMEPSGEFQGLGLSEFLQSLTDSPYLTSIDPTSHTSFSNLPTNSEAGLSGGQIDGGGAVGAGAGAGTGTGTAANGGASTGHSVPGSPVNKTERFLLTAADQKDGSRSDRLARVIHAKFEAGLLRPYNHVAGYTRLMRWMADNMSQSSRQRTLHTLSEFRPAFRAIASGLTDLDLVFIEEAFERLLLDYDRVFSSMGIPSCLWRRTGEIYKGNKEFAALVGVPLEHLQGGKLAIYELMAEESAVNYWEKYGNIAFDAGQKAVLTSCVLVNQAALSKKRKSSGSDKARRKEEAMINCCFSFTIRRDSYAIPSMIVGNFLRF